MTTLRYGAPWWANLGAAGPNIVEGLYLGERSVQDAKRLKLQESQRGVELLGLAAKMEEANPQFAQVLATLAGNYDPALANLKIAQGDPAQRRVEEATRQVDALIRVSPSLQAHRDHLLQQAMNFTPAKEGKVKIPVTVNTPQGPQTFMVDEEKYGLMMQQAQNRMDFKEFASQFGRSVGGALGDRKQPMVQWVDASTGQWLGSGPADQPPSPNAMPSQVFRLQSGGSESYSPLSTLEMNAQEAKAKEIAGAANKGTLTPEERARYEEAGYVFKTAPETVKPLFPWGTPQVEQVTTVTPPAMRKTQRVKKGSPGKPTAPSAAPAKKKPTKRYNQQTGEFEDIQQ